MKKPNINLNLNYSKIINLLKENKTNEALSEINNISNHEKNFDLISLKASIYLKLGEFKNSYNCYSIAIEQKKNSFDCYISRAFALFELGEFKKSIKDFERGLKINNKSSAVFENIGKCYSNLGENEKAIDYFNKALSLDPENNRIIEMISEKLTQTNLETKTKSLVVDTDNLIKKIKYKSLLKAKINDIDIKNILDRANNLIKINFNNLIFHQTQIFRKNNVDLNCDRHFLVFGNFKVIPEFCFSCIKISIDVKNVVDLIKLFLIFNDIKLEKNNLRKCMIDLRPSSKTNYKGFIYCRSIDEASKIKTYIDSIIHNTISKSITSNIKRGCAEFSKKYPGYENISKNIINYNSDWKRYEEIIDKKFPKFNSMKKNQKTLKGVSFYDIMVIRNWLYFAKMTKDNSYKRISNDLFANPSLEKIIKRNKLIN